MRIILKLYLSALFLIIVLATAMPMFSGVSLSSDQRSTYQDYRDYQDLKEFFDNERLNVVFLTEHGNYTWGLEVKNGTAKGTVGGVEDPTIVIKCDYYLAMEIMNSEQPILRIIDELMKGNIIEIRPDDKLEKELMDDVLALLKVTKSIAENILNSQTAR